MTTDDKPPQYTAFRAENSGDSASASPPQQPPEEDELSRRCRLWRDKNPSRAEALRRVVGPLLGYTPNTTLSPRIINAFCEPTENRIIGAIYGVEERES